MNRPCAATEKLMSGSVRLLVVPLNVPRDVGGKDRLEPVSRAAADDPGVSRGYRASKAGGELRSSQGKAIVPSHGCILPRKIKNAMRKINEEIACGVLRIAYSLRMSNTIQLTKPSSQYNQEERRQLWVSLVKGNRQALAAKNGGWLSGAQQSSAKGIATRAMLKAGF